MKKKLISEWAKETYELFKDFYFQEPEECVICRQSLGVIYASWTSPENIANQQAFLISEVCPQLDDMGGSSVGVLTWWERIAKTLFSELGAYFHCYQINHECAFPNITTTR